jgi:anti-anti-sigma factor
VIAYDRLPECPSVDRLVAEHPRLSIVPWQRNAFSVSVSSADGCRVIHVAGELDLATRDVVHGACVVDDGHQVVVDLAEITFLDCSGYSGLIAARQELEDRGGSLVWRDPSGQPARFLALLSVVENARPIG